MCEEEKHTDAHREAFKLPVVAQPFECFRALTLRLKERHLIRLVGFARDQLALTVSGAGGGGGGSSSGGGGSNDDGHHTDTAAVATKIATGRRAE